MRQWIRIVESIGDEIIRRNPMLFHGTSSARVESVLMHGLGGNRATANYDISMRGTVYLSDDPSAAANWAVSPTSPTDIEEVVLVIDTTFLNPALLSIDENDDDALHGGTSYAYKGVIPPQAIKRYEW